MSNKVLSRLLLSLLLLTLTITAPSPVEAACEYGHTIRTTYYGWVAGNDVLCSNPMISPQVYTRQVIGEITYSECTDTWDSWGDTTTCPNNWDQTGSRCGLICQ